MTKFLFILLQLEYKSESGYENVLFETVRQKKNAHKTHSPQPRLGCKKEIEMYWVFL